MEHLKCDFDFRLVFENGMMDIVWYVPVGVGGGYCNGKRMCSNSPVTLFAKISHMYFYSVYIYLTIF
jgi:hypothetical protein